jgi:hypothetical protein
MTFIKSIAKRDEFCDCSSGDDDMMMMMMMMMIVMAQRPSGH